MNRISLGITLNVLCVLMACHTAMAQGAAISIARKTAVLPGGDEIAASRAEFGPNFGWASVIKLHGGDFFMAGSEDNTPPFPSTAQRIYFRRTDATWVTRWQKALDLKTGGSSRDFGAMIDTADGKVKVLFGGLPWTIGQSGELIHGDPNQIGARYTDMAASPDQLYLIGPPSGSECRPPILEGRDLASMVVRWTLPLGRGFNCPDFRTGIWVDADRGVLAAGPEYGTTTLVSVSTDGHLRWRKSFSEVPFRKDIRKVLRLPDGGYLFVAGAASGSNPGPFGGKDVWVVWLNADGTTRFDRSYGGIGDEDPRLVAHLPDGGFLIVAQAEHSQASGNKTVDGDGLWLIKISATGEIQEQSILPGMDPVLLAPFESGFRLLRKQRQATSGAELVACNVRFDSRYVLKLSVQGNESVSLQSSQDLRQWDTIARGIRGALQLDQPLRSVNQFFRYLPE